MIEIEQNSQFVCMCCYSGQDVNDYVFASPFADTTIVPLCPDCRETLFNLMIKTDGRCDGCSKKDGDGE